MRSLEKQLVQSYQQRLQQYEETFTKAIHQQYPLRDEARRQLQRLQQSLGLEEEIIKAIEAQVIQAYEQKLQQYQAVFTRAIQRQYPLSNDDNRFLEDFRQVVDLTQNQIDQADEQKLQDYEAAFTQVIHQQYPISDEARCLLNHLLQNLELRYAAVKSIEAQVTQTYEQKLQQYQAVFTRAIQRQYPVSDNDGRFLANLRRAFNLNPKITDSIETLENLRRVLNLNEAITDSIEAKAIETYTLNSSFPTSLLQGGKYQQKVRQLVVKITVVAIVLTSISLAARTIYVQRWQANQAARVALDVAKALKAKEMYEPCTRQAKEIPQGSRFYLEAQTLLKQCQHLAQDEQWLTQAKALATKNSFKNAIAWADKIQPSSTLHQEAQLLISQWSENPLQRAERQSSQPSNFSQTGLKQGKESKTITKASRAKLVEQQVKQNTSYQQSTRRSTTPAVDQPVATRNSQASKTVQQSSTRQSSTQRSTTGRSATRQSVTQRSTTGRSATRQSTTQQSTRQHSSSGGWMVDQE